jgi:hypothetical protein
VKLHQRRHSGERGNPVRSDNWFPDQARNDGKETFSCMGASKSLIMGVYHENWMVRDI